VAERGLRQQALAAWRATVEPGHLGAGAGLVDKDELVGIDEGLRRLPDAAPGGNIRPVLLGGAERLFLNDKPRRSTADHIAPLLNCTACSAARGHLLRRGQFARPVTAPRAGAHLPGPAPPDQRLVDVRHAHPENGSR